MVAHDIEPGRGCAWVTGASSGIGRAAALEFARRGWTVIASARRQDQLDTLAEELAQGGAGSGAGRIVPMVLDVTDAEACAATVSRIEEEVGPVVLALLAAGSYVKDDLDSFTAEHFRQHMDLNYMGTINVLAPLLQAMRPRRSGQVMVVSSVSGYRGLPQAMAYGSSKAALNNLMESLKFAADGEGIITTLINPGFVKTPLTDRNTFAMPALMPVDEAARRIAGHIGNRRFELTFPRRFTFWMQRLRCLPYAVYFPLMKKATGQ